MQKYFEKIIERLEEELEWSSTHGKDVKFKEGRLSGLRTSMRIVNQVAEEVAVAENATTNDGLIALPKEAFDRMIARMESESERDIYEEESLFINVRDAARIIKEILVEYQPKGEG